MRRMDGLILKNDEGTAYNIPDLLFFQTLVALIGEQNRTKMSGLSGQSLNLLKPHDIPKLFMKLGDSLISEKIFGGAPPHTPNLS